MGSNINSENLQNNKLGQNKDSLLGVFLFSLLAAPVGMRFWTEFGSISRGVAGLISFIFFLLIATILGYIFKFFYSKSKIITVLIIFIIYFKLFVLPIMYGSQ